MGHERIAPGKQNAAQAALAAESSTSSTVGKSTQVERTYGHEVAAAADRGDTNHFLTPALRTDLDGQNRYRLSVILSNIGLALETLRVEQMIKKPEELGIFMTLILGVVESVLTAYAGVAIKMLRKPGAGKAAVAELGDGAAKVAASAAAEVSTDLQKAGKDAEKSMVNLTEVQLNSVVKGSLAKSKTAASKGLAGTSSSEDAATNEKAQASGYLLQLKAEADVAFDDLSQQIGRIDDAKAIAWWKALAPQQHSQAVYEGKFRVKLNEYLASSVSKIGRSMDWEGTKHVEKEVRIVRVLVPGAGVRYAEQDAVFDAYLVDHPGQAERSPAYDAEQGALSLSQDATWNVGGKEQRSHEEPLLPEQVKLNYVPHDLEEMAVQKQEHVWQRPIETYQLTFVGGRPHLVKIAGA